jgi:putative Holliday junction resolvase
MTNEGRILGLDYGTKRVGVAISDPMRVIAQGVGTLENNSSLLENLKEIVLGRQVTIIVVGIPYGPDGETGGKAREVGTFIEMLKGSVGVPVDTWDESYSSVAAQRVFIEGGMKRRKRRQKERVDEMAARVMLQEYLDLQVKR